MASSNNGFRLRIYNTLNDYYKRKQLRDVEASELLRERNVLIIGEKGGGKSKLLYELWEAGGEAASNFHFDRFNYEEILNRLLPISKQGGAGNVFIDNFFGKSTWAFDPESVRRLNVMLEDFPKFSFYVVVNFEGFAVGFEKNESFGFSRNFKIAELISDESEEVIFQQQSEPVEEIKQEKSEPEEEVVQKKEKSPKNKRKPSQFQPTSTKYDELFRGVINSVEFDVIRQAENFVLEEERNHYKAFKSLQELQPNFEIAEIEKILGKEGTALMSIDTVSLDLPTNQTWDAIIVVLDDLMKAYNFLSREPDTYGKIRSMALEWNWVWGLVKMLSSPDKTILLDSTLLNYTFYFETPANSPYIFDEDVKKQIVEKVFEKEYDTREFTQLLWSYFESLSQNNPKNPENLGYFVASVLLHPKIRSIWDDAQQNAKTPPLLSNDNRLIGKYSPDEASEEDHLGFKHDVHALAALIAYDKTPLPLAIGLFGNWGSGKSSFMKQLEKRIDVLSEEQYKNPELANSPDAVMPYCTNITHITFNAWHYSDGNLWASMMVHIFDELLEKIAASKTREELRAELLKKLSTASEAVVEAEKRVAESKVKLTQANSALTAINSQRTGMNTELATVQLSLKDVFGTLMKDAQFSTTIQQLAKESGYDKVIENKQQLEKWKSEMDSFWERLVKAYKNIYRANKLAAVLVVIVPVFISAVFYYLYTKKVLESVNAIITAATVSILPFIGKMMEQVRKINTSLRRLESLQKEKVDKKEMELKEREKYITEEIKQHEATVAEQQKEVEAAKKEESDAKAALDAIDINRQLTSFIQQRQGGNSYQQHLGIISLIRKDFGELRKFLKASNKEKKPKERIIERIVLYIDDLDRCKTDRVVAVLEAVHLLLAFDLFVVVVGVDPRWVSKALKEQYKEQLHLDAAEDSDTSRLPGQRATPFDYLEKIFQVPFVLRSMDNSGAKKLLDNLFKDQVKLKDIQVAIDTNVYANATSTMLLNRTTEDGKKEPTPEEIMAAAKQAFEDEIKKKKQLEEEEEKKEFIEQVENLSISEDELNFMKSIAPIIGATPRTVKRYGNLYRLLRVHNDIPNYSTESLPVYQSVMLLLSISVSNGSIARSFFNALKDSKKSGFYEVNVELVSIVQTAVSALNKLEEKDEETKEKLESLTEQLQSLIQLKDTLGKLPDEVKNFSVATLKKYSPVVSRFSFRTLNCVEEEIQK